MEIRAGKDVKVGGDVVGQDKVGRDKKGEEKPPKKSLLKPILTVASWAKKLLGIPGPNLK